MRKSLLLTVAALAAFSAPALAQSTTAQPVMPAPRNDATPNSNVAPMNSAPMAAPEGRAAAPNGPIGETAPNGNVRGKARSGGNGS